MKSFITAFWNYTKNPSKEAGPAFYPIKSKIGDCCIAILVYFIAATVLSVLAGVLAKLILHFYSINLLAVRDTNIGTAVKGTSALLIIALVAPTLEETMFRLWLSFKKLHVFLALTTISLFVLTKFNHGSLYAPKVDTVFLVRLACALSLGTVFYLLFNLSFFKKEANIHFKLFYWGSCLVFGLLHLLNFAPLKSSLLWAYPFFVLPQLALGFILGYLRVKNGFFWALLVHCLVNLPGAFFYYFK
jgi:membrane protease YdiL (CAAX protease family)